MASNSHVTLGAGSAPKTIFAIRPGEITQAPTRAQSLVDAAFRRLSFLFACSTILLVTFIVLRIAVSAVPAMRHDGLSFLTGRVWDPNSGQHGIAGEIWGTLYTSVLALVIGTAFGVAAALFLSEGYMGQAIFATSASFESSSQSFLVEGSRQGRRPVEAVDRTAGRDPQRSLWPLGFVRCHPADSSGVQLAAP